MPKKPKRNNKNLIFAVSDTHFNNRSPENDIEDFFLFLEKVRREAGKLILLGDIFDFYFEYKTVIPRTYFPVFCELQKTSKSGVEIHYWAGNHDFWLGDFIRDLGVILHFYPEVITVCGRRILIEHGHNIDSPDILRTILQNRLSRALYSIIHPDIGIGLAGIVSRLSRAASENSAPDISQFIRYAQGKFAQDIDSILMGHIHHPHLYREGEKTLAIVGDWFNHRSFGIISNGRISLNRFSQPPM